MFAAMCDAAQRTNMPILTVFRSAVMVILRSGVIVCVDFGIDSPLLLTPGICLIRFIRNQLPALGASSRDGWSTGYRPGLFFIPSVRHLKIACFGGMVSKQDPAGYQIAVFGV